MTSNNPTASAPHTIPTRARRWLVSLGFQRHTLQQHNGFTFIEFGDHL